MYTEGFRSTKISQKKKMKEKEKNTTILTNVYLINKRINRVIGVHYLFIINQLKISKCLRSIELLNILYTTITKSMEQLYRRFRQNIHKNFRTKKNQHTFYGFSPNFLWSNTHLIRSIGVKVSKQVKVAKCRTELIFSAVFRS